MRRKPPLTEAIPEELCRFVRAEWPAADSAWQAVDVWTGARLAWIHEHPDARGALGDSVDVLRAGLATRRRLQQCPW